MATFQTARYKLDGGAIALMRVDKADIAVDGNEIPAGAGTLRIYNRRKRGKTGIKVRRLVVKQLLRAGVAATGIPDQYKFAYITILDPASLENYTIGEVIEYRGTSWIVEDYQREG
jgi:hypothetical protein